MPLLETCERLASYKRETRERETKGRETRERRRYGWREPGIAIATEKF